MEPIRGRGRARSNLQATGLPRNLGPVRPQIPRPNVPQQVPDQSQRDVQVVNHFYVFIVPIIYSCYAFY